MRTQNSIKNTLTTFIPFLIIGVLGFIKVKVFVAFLKDDLYSLNQLFYQIFSYLSLAEAGFGLLITQKYYKAIAQNNLKEIKAIYATSIAFFRRVGLIIIGLSLVVSFFVHFLSKTNINHGYIQLIFMVFVIKNSIDYFLMAPRFLIAADQKMFKINILVNAAKIIEVIVEIAIVWSGVDYLIILLPGILIRIGSNLIINQKVFTLYPYIQNVKSKMDSSKLKDIKHLIIQRLAGMLHGNTDIILISSFINPTAVIAYTSYTYLTKNIFDVVYIISGAISSSLASLLNAGRKKASAVFDELKNLYILMASFVFIFLSVFLENIIMIWVGEKYIISIWSLAALIGFLYLQIAMRPFYMAVDAEGYFKEVKSIITHEAILNLVLSVLLVKPLGLLGVLSGTLLSTILVILILLPKLVYGKIINGSQAKLFVILAINTVLNIIGTILISFVLKNAVTVWQLLFNILIGLIIISIYVFASNYHLLKLSRTVERVKLLYRERNKKDA